MTTRVRNPLVSLLTAFLLRLRFPYLFAIAAVLFVVNLIVPDPIPFIDELMLGLLAALLASLQGKDDDDDDARRIAAGGPRTGGSS